MSPEEKARKKIDQMFDDAGWKVVDRDHYAPKISAVAIEEGLLEHNLEADYFLFLNGKAVGVLEAKREEVDVKSDVVCAQAVLYARSVPSIRHICCRCRSSINQTAILQYSKTCGMKIPSMWS